jgi:protein-disulfide isomerase
MLVSSSKFRPLLILFFCISATVACSTKKVQEDLPPIVIPPRGDAQAKLVIHQFSDFQCAPCGAAAYRLKSLVEKTYAGKVQLYFRHMPLAQHVWARSAARATVAAAIQGKFWQMHDGVFSNQKSLSPRLYQKLAYDIGLDVIQFEQDMKNSRAESIIAHDSAEARKLGVTSTPTVYIGAVKLVGLKSKKEYARTIREELARISN